MHLDAEARMQNYEDENGKKQSRLSLVQSKPQDIPLNPLKYGIALPLEIAVIP